MDSVIESDKKSEASPVKKKDAVFDDNESSTLPEYR